MLEVVVVMILLWGINGFLSVFKAGKVFDYFMAEDNITANDVDIIYGYHSSFNLKNWLGFRHWFYPYKKNEKS